MSKKIELYTYTFILSFLAFSGFVLAERTEVGDMTYDCSVIPSEVLDMIQMFWSIIVIAGPVILIVMSLIDIAKTITSGEDGAFKKCLGRIVKRIIALVILIILPIIINFILQIINSSFSTCVS